MNATTMVYVVKPSLKAQLVAEMPMYARHFRIPVDKINIVTYSELSDASTRGILHDIKPDLIVFDEAHRIRNKESARTKRVRWYLKDYPATRTVYLSGTLANRRISEFAPFAEAALRSGSPLPSARYGDLRDWGDCLDGYEDADRPPLEPGALLSLCNEEELRALNPKNAARSGFRRRLTETRGVISTVEGEESLGCSLEIRARRPEMPKEVTDALAHLEKLWSWDDNDHDDPMSKARVERQLSSGFYYKWQWPGGIKDEEWLSARGPWFKEVRDFLSNRARPGMDSPFLYEKAVIEGYRSSTYSAWSAVKNRKPPPVKAVWLSDFVVRDVKDWLSWLPAKGNRSSCRGLIWYKHTALGERVAADLGLPLFGDDSGKELNEMLNSKHPARALVLSATAHLEGVNAQYAYAHNLILNAPSQGKDWEQLLGRTHRRGQPADEVTNQVLLHAPIQERAMRISVTDAEFAQFNLGQRQKLLYAARVGW